MPPRQPNTNTEHNNNKRKRNRQTIKLSDIWCISVTSANREKHLCIFPLFLFFFVTFLVLQNQVVNSARAIVIPNLHATDLFLGNINIKQNQIIWIDATHTNISHVVWLNHRAMDSSIMYNHSYCYVVVVVFFGYCSTETYT